jgi:hypothetical protein
MIRSLFILNALLISTTCIYAQTNSYPATGNVGIGTTTPQAFLDISNPTINTLTAVLGRLPEGNNNAPGTYLGVKAVNTATIGTISFSLEHRFYGLLNNAINFYRGNDKTGGFMTFATKDGTEQMCIDGIGRVGIGTLTPATKLEIDNGNMQLTSGTSTQTGGSSCLGIVTTGLNTSNGFSEIQAFYAGIGNTASLVFQRQGGNVLIGKSTQTNSTYKLDVNGNIRANKITVNTTGADFVFDSAYKIASLSKIETFIKMHHHLPEIETAGQMQEEGMDLGKTQTKLLQKIEELTLYAIDANKQIGQQKMMIDQQQSLLLKLQQQLKIQQQAIDELRNPARH